MTQQLLDCETGDKSALDKLTPVVYSELRRLAGAYLSRQGPEQTLQPTALVHEAYLRLAEQSRLGWRNRAHFFGIAAQCMRQILVEHARSRHAAKRGGGWHRLALEDVVVISDARSSEILDLDDALNQLAAVDSRKSQIIQLRYFGGLTAEEMAVVLGVSQSTVERDLKVAQAWLHRELSGGAT